MQKRFTISEVAADWHELMIPRALCEKKINSVLTAECEFLT